MVRRHISTELKKSALSMSLEGMSDAEIREITGISERSLKRLRSVYRKTGDVVLPPPIDAGRPRVLTAIHVKVRHPNDSGIIAISSSPIIRKYLCDCVERRRDVPLLELKTELRQVFDVNVSVQTIARSLQRVGVCKENSTSAMYCKPQIMFPHTHTINDRPRAPLKRPAHGWPGRTFISHTILLHHSAGSRNSHAAFRH